jgi:hypothetical protein
MLSIGKYGDLMISTVFDRNPHFIIPFCTLLIKDIETLGFPSILYPLNSNYSNQLKTPATWIVSPYTPLWFRMKKSDATAIGYTNGAVNTEAASFAYTLPV